MTLVKKWLHVTKSEKLRDIYLLSQVGWWCFPVQILHRSWQFLNISHHTVTDWIESDWNVRMFIYCLQAPVPHIHKLMNNIKETKSLPHALLKLYQHQAKRKNCLAALIPLDEIQLLQSQPEVFEHGYSMELKREWKYKDVPKLLGMQAFGLSPGN